MVGSDKKYLKISEAAKLCGTKEHILRYWEKHFDELNPIKRNNRRYYQQKDLDLILNIKDLLMTKKFTLDGAKKMIAQKVNQKTQPAKHSNQQPIQAKTNQSSKLLDSKNNQSDKNSHNHLSASQKNEILKDLQSILTNLKH